jgi:N-methylhydantoinase A/oxoprolinase/acetone carboxylase beta subunit
MTRVGADVGRTFTDVVVTGDDGGLTFATPRREPATC